MDFHTPELIDFLDDHWCNVMTAHAAEHPFGDTPRNPGNIGGPSDGVPRRPFENVAGTTGFYGPRSDD